jgi:carotenoid cleavage dioxygenase-like enzyme
MSLGGYIQHIIQCVCVCVCVCVCLDHSLRIHAGAGIDPDDRYPVKFGFFPRHAAGAQDVRWSRSVLAGVIFHVAAAWEEPDPESAGCVLVLWAVVHPARFAFQTFARTEQHGALRGVLTEYRINATSGEVTVAPFPLPAHVGATGVEFPRIPEARTGYRTRFVYAVTTAAEPASGMLTFPGLVKFDLQTRTVRELAFATPHEAVAATEAVFVSGGPGSDAAAVAEDHGVLLVLLFRPSSNSSELRVINASSMSAEPLASARLPQRVPHGFHANFFGHGDLRPASAPGTSA